MQASRQVSRAIQAALGATMVTLFASFALTPAHADAVDAEAFVAAFGEVCIPERLSYEGTVALAGQSGWTLVMPGANEPFDRFIEHAETLLQEEIADEPDFYHGSDGAWFTREIGGRPHLLAVSLLLTEFMDTAGCYLYDFAATEPIDPEPLTRLLGRPMGYTTDGGDPDYAVDPAELVSMVWGPPPALPRTGDTYLTFIPEGSPHAARIGFTGLMLKFSTSLPSWEERQQ